MTGRNATRKHTFQMIDGVEAVIGLASDELYLDLPANSPRYICVREGHQIQEGDVRTQTSQTMESPALSRWRIDKITEDTVTGVDIDTGDSKEWDRDWLIQQIGIGEFSVELTDFDRVSVSETSGIGGSYTDDRNEDGSPNVIVSVFGNNGQQFTQIYSATDPGGWESLTLVKQDRNVPDFDEELRQKFDAAITRALELEQRYHE